MSGVRVFVKLCQSYVGFDSTANVNIVGLHLKLNSRTNDREERRDE